MVNWETKSLATRAAEQLDGNLWAAVGYVALGTVGILVFVALAGLVLIYAERKIAAHFQCRLGPMRVGWHGLLQSVADALKLLLKEDVVPEKADRLLHLVAPFFALVATMLALVAIPLSPIVQVSDLNIGVMYVVAVSGLGVLGILIGGWSSNNKWSLLGAMRSGAQIISYEMSATLAILVIVLFSGSLQLSQIVQSQQAGWWIWRAHGIGVVAFLIFITASIAEINRTPFDMPEAESELTGGFHTEYSGLRFAFFFLSEFVNMFVASALAVTLFWGGWMPFHLGNFAAFNQVMDLIPPLLWFWLKCGAVLFLMIWVRWSFPRLRVDQLMKLEWKFLMPLGLLNLVLAAIAVVFNLYFFPDFVLTVPGGV